MMNTEQWKSNKRNISKDVANIIEDAKDVLNKKFKNAKETQDHINALSLIRGHAIKLRLYCDKILK